MKIEAYVLSVADHGDRLEITAQGNAAGAADWRPVCSVSLSIPITEHNRRAYYVGRRFDVTLTPRPT
jgi:hypothetical protein